MKRQTSEDEETKPRSQVSDREHPPYPTEPATPDTTRPTSTFVTGGGKGATERFKVSAVVGQASAIGSGASTQYRVTT